MKALDLLLGEHPLFAGIEPAHLAIIQGCARHCRFESGRYVFREGEPADEFFVIRNGRVALEIGAPGHQPVVFETLGAGEMVGASWLIPPYRWMSDARAMEPTGAIGIDAACLREKCERDHDLGYLMMKRFLPVLAERLHATRLQVLDVYGKH